MTFPHLRAVKLSGEIFALDGKPPGRNNVSGERWMSSVKGCNRLKTYRTLDGSAILSKGLREDF